MKIYIVSLRFHWGYSIRHPFSSRIADSYLIPPFTTIIGALAKSISVKEGNRIEHLVMGSKVVGSSSLKYVNLIKDYAVMFEGKPLKFTTLLRHSTSPYWVTTYDIFKGERNFFAPIETGMVSYVSGLMRILVICNNIAKDDFYSITRLGSKESIVSVLGVEELSKDKIIKKSFKEKVPNVTFSFNFDVARPVLGSYTIENITEFDELFYKYDISEEEVLLKINKVIIPQPIVSVELKKDAYVCDTPYGKAILEHAV